MNRSSRNPYANPAVFTIKLCGIRSVEDARVAADAGADAIGLNFYSKSKRFVAVE